MIAFVFPGQGSQKPGMGKDLAETFPIASQIFDRVSRTVGTDMKALCWETDDDTLRQTQNAQLALYTSGLAAYHALTSQLSDSKLDNVAAVAGHSVGEYAALAAAGVMTVEQGAKLVQLRGQVMAKSGEEWPGTMAAVLGLDRAALEEVCTSVDGVVVVANDNCPGQLVISGEVEAVKLTGEAASAKGAKRVLPLNVSGAFHSPLMEKPAEGMRLALQGGEFYNSPVKVYSNVTSEPVADPKLWPTLLEEQLRNPVRWSESIQHMLRDGINKYIECGGGEVLSGLVRRIDKSATTLKVGDSASLAETLATLNA